MRERSQGMGLLFMLETRQERVEDDVITRHGVKWARYGKYLL